MKITFVGSGGGRVMLITQKLKTCGFIVDINDFSVYFDPGPGALLTSRMMKINIDKVYVIFISHAHLEHYNDAEALIEVMTKGGTIKRGALIASVGIKKQNIIRDYFIDRLEYVHFIKANESVKIKGITFRATSTIHRDECIGIILDNGKEKIGYTADTEYFNGLINEFMGCDVLVINLMRRSENKLPFHMDVNGAIRIINGVKPKIAILTHIGMSLYKYGINRLEKEIQEKCDSNIIFARDGLKINTKGQKTLFSLS